MRRRAVSIDARPRAFSLLLLALAPLLGRGEEAKEGGSKDAGQLITLTEKQLFSKWFFRQPYFLVEWHGHAGQKLHNDIVPALKEVAQELHGRARVGEHWVKGVTTGVQAKFGLDLGKFPSLHLFRQGEVIRKWEPVTSWVQKGEEFTQGEVKGVTAEDIVEWVQEHMEKAEKKAKKRKARKGDPEKGSDEL